MTCAVAARQRKHGRTHYRVQFCAVRHRRSLQHEAYNTGHADAALSCHLSRQPTIEERCHGGLRWCVWLFVFRLCLCVWFPRWPASRAGNRNKADAELDATSEYGPAARRTVVPSAACRHRALRRIARPPSPAHLRFYCARNGSGRDVHASAGLGSCPGRPRADAARACGAVSSLGSVDDA